MIRLTMLRPIEFDNQSSFQADKINNVITHRVLTAKTAPIQLLLLQRIPQPSFSICLVFS